MKYIDAFKVHNAPSETKEGMFRDYKVYLPEAYTDAYMIRSDKTGRLCRYLIEDENGFKQSVYGYYGVRKSTKYPHNAFYKVLAKMSKNERYQLYRTLCTERFEKDLDGWEWLEQTGAGDTRSIHTQTELYCIYNNSEYLNEFSYAVWAGFEG